MLAKNQSTPAPAQLSDLYYLDNFGVLIDFVETHYLHLLYAVEVQFCSDFKNLPDDARKLYVRMALRAPDLLRLSKLRYPEIASIDKAIEDLATAQFISYTTDPDIEQCLQLFSQSELKSAGLPGNKSVNSSHWTSPDLFGQTPLARVTELDKIVEVHHKAHINTFSLLFFGNLHQDFSSFVLRDMGLRRYESYVIDSDTLLFHSRQQLQAHMEYYLCADAFDAACELGTDALTALHAQLPKAIETDSTLTRRLHNLANKIARQLERNEALTDAAEIYTQNTRPPARERLARINAKLGENSKALALCKEIIDKPTDCDELDFATSFGYRLASKTMASKTMASKTTPGNKTEHDFCRPVPYKPPEIKLALAPQNLNVEFSVALHLAKCGKCHYLENTLLSGMFGLAFWDIIFAPIKGVFFHPFQSRPADLYEPEFISQREDCISQRLTAIANGDLHHFAFKHLFKKSGIRNPFIHWNILRPHIVHLALQRIPPTDWHAIFSLLLTDVKNYRAGQPDLVWFPDDGGYQLLEVKAPGDRLQTNQLRWMRFFKSQSIKHGVVHVEWINE